MLQSYLSKRALKPAYIEEPPKRDLGLVVVIPAHNEESLIPCINSLHSCTKTSSSVEVIVVFNASVSGNETIKQQNIEASSALKSWYNKLQDKWFDLLIIEENRLPAKHAGVGLARKIGMDEAVRRFEMLNRTDGVITCFDADSACQPNYLKEIENHFIQNPKTTACSIYFEHPIKGDEFSNEVYEGILFYEIHLRYYKNGLAYAGLPFAFHTIGSSMAVRADAYCKEGGMNKRKAGEDFYFLQKFISKGDFSELNSTCVIPSPRASDRVPFGTGRAIQEMLDGQRNIKESYAFETFEILRSCFNEVSSWYKNPTNIHPILLEFVGEEIFSEKLAEIRQQSRNEVAFVKRFYQWFNAFQTLKFVHYIRDNYFGFKPLVEELPKLILAMKGEALESIPTLLLESLRKLDRA